MSTSFWLLRLVKLSSSMSERLTPEHMSPSLPNPTLLLLASALQLQPGDSIHALCSNLQNKTSMPSNSSCIRCGSELTPEKCVMTHLALSMCLLAKPGMGKSWACTTGSNSMIKSRKAGWITRAMYFHESMGMLHCPHTFDCLTPNAAYNHLFYITAMHLQARPFVNLVWYL